MLKILNIAPGPIKVIIIKVKLILRVLIVLGT